MEQSDVLSQVNLNYTNKNRQNGLRHFRQQEAAKQKGSQKQIIEEVIQKHGSPVRYNTQINKSQQYQQQKKQDYSSRYTDYSDQSLISNGTPHKEINMTDTIQKILDNNQKYYNLKALKSKSLLQNSQYKMNTYHQNKILSFQKMEDIIIEPCERDLDDYDGLKKQKYMIDFSKKEEEYIEKVKNQQNIIELQNYQYEIVKIKNHCDIEEVKNIIGQTNLFLLDEKVLQINIQSLLQQLVGEEGQSLSKRVQENIQILLQRISKQKIALENILIDNQVAYKIIGEPSQESSQKKSNGQQNGINNGNSQKSQEQMFEKDRMIEKLKYIEISNKKEIEKLKLKNEEYEEHLQSITDNHNSPENLKVNLKKIIDIHKQIKQQGEESDVIQKKNDILNQQLNQLKSENRNLADNIHPKVKQLYMKLVENKLDQNPVSIIIQEKSNEILELQKQKKLVDQLIEQNKQDYEQKSIDLFMKLEQTLATVNTLEKKLIETQSNRLSSDKQQTNSATNERNESNQNTQKIKNEYENKLKLMNEKSEEKDKKIKEINEKLSAYINIAFYLNDMLVEISEIKDYKSIRQKLDQNREQIYKFYEITSADKDRNQMKIQSIDKQFIDSLYYRLDDIPDNYMHALFMQAITIEEMVKQAEQVQMITNEMENTYQQHNQQSQDPNQKNNNLTNEQQQKYQQQQNNQYQQQQQSHKQNNHLQNSIIQEQSYEDDDLNEAHYLSNYSNSNSKKSLDYHHQQQINQYSQNKNNSQ